MYNNYLYIGNDNLNDIIQVRLVSGPDAHEGRIEILYAGIWGAICNDLFNLTAANVVCRQLGYPGAVRVMPSYTTYNYYTHQIWLDDVQCTGNETSIDQCSHNGFNIYDCNFDTDQVGIECISEFLFLCCILHLTICMYTYVRTYVINHNVICCFSNKFQLTGKLPWGGPR